LVPSNSILETVPDLVGVFNLYVII